MSARQRLSVAEFGRYIRERNPRSYRFRSEDQPGFDVAAPLQMALDFSSIFVWENPNLISIGDKQGNEVMFYSVIYVEVSERERQILIYLYCGKYGSDSIDDEYRLTAIRE